MSIHKGQVPTDPWDMNEVVGTPCLVCSNFDENCMKMKNAIFVKKKNLKFKFECQCNQYLDLNEEFATTGFCLPLSLSNGSVKYDSTPAYYRYLSTPQHHLPVTKGYIRSGPATRQCLFRFCWCVKDLESWTNQPSTYCKKGK